MSIKLSDKQEQIIQDLSEKIDKIRLEQYEKAVENIEEAHRESATLSDKISRGELKNLVVARPTKPKRPEFLNETDVQKYIRRLRNEATYGVERAQMRFIDNYAESVAKAWGEELAQEILNFAQSSPEKFIELVNTKQLPSIKFAYRITDNATIESYMETFAEKMTENE